MMWKLVVVTAYFVQANGLEESPIPLSSINCLSDPNNTFGYTENSCVDAHHPVRFEGSCVKGVKEEEFQVAKCLDFYPYCHACPQDIASFVTCSPHKDQATACQELANETVATVPNNLTCEDSTDPFSFITSQCLNQTNVMEEALHCHPQNSLGTKSSSQKQCPADRPSCLSCQERSATLCAPAGVASCSDIGTTPASETPMVPVSSVECGAVNFTFVAQTCLDSSAFAIFTGSCTNGDKIESAYGARCYPSLPYCHECGLKKVTCSKESDPTLACQDVVQAIPSNVTCSELPVNTLVFGAGCTNDTTYGDEYIFCDGNNTVENTVVHTQCSLSTPMCMSCEKSNVICAPAGTTCADVDGTSSSSSWKLGSLVSFSIFALVLIFI